MLYLSQIIIANQDTQSFEELSKLVVEYAQTGEIHFRMDVKPPFGDTPDDWEEKLEAAFSTAPRR